MRIYSSVLEAVKEIERDLFEMGIISHAPTVQDMDVLNNPDYESRELLGYSYSLTGFSDINSVFDFFFRKDEIDNIKSYCRQELSERISGCSINPGKSWVHRKQYWEKFIHNGRFSYTYSERMSDQLTPILKELIKNPDSRQCVITIYDKHNDLRNIGGKARIPCSMFYHLMLRKINNSDKLLLVYSMRSCDFYTHFPVDLWLAVSFGLWVSSVIRCSLHSVIHFIDSLHAFKKDWGNRRIF